MADADKARDADDAPADDDVSDDKKSVDVKDSKDSKKELKKSKKAKKKKDGERKPLFKRMALFFRQTVAELRKVIWPTRRELIQYTWVVLVFCTIMALLIAGFDFVFAKLVLYVFGS